ncbi:uncharacterized protein LOC135388745 [Ornithodoros turicata]|uniref:uncharacterized protein LOC135388745 n=1 Tax=Ornithodoros turicata TaxID=34597 RepID=UPI00313934D1
MDLHELFRSFFGFPNYRGDQRHGAPRGEEEQQNDGSIQDWDPFAGSFFAEPWDALKHFEDSFSRFGMPEPFFREVPNPDGLWQTPGCLRDRMLKEPDGPTQLVPHHLPSKDELEGLRDTDLDDHVAVAGLDSLLPPVQPIIPQSSTAVHSFSSVNGRIEERKVVTDAMGNREVTVRRAIGDRSHTLTTRTDATGAQHTEEQLVNMDEAGKTEFDKMWQSPGQQLQVHPPTEGGDNSASIFRRLFGFNLPGRS